jgi:hypothetical protein
MDFGIGTLFTGGFITILAFGYRSIFVWLDRIKRVKCEVSLQPYSICRPVLYALMEDGFRYWEKIQNAT